MHGEERAIAIAASISDKAAQAAMVAEARKRLTPLEVVQAVHLLASDEASYINGQALTVDGGLSTSLPLATPRVLGKTTF